MSSPVEALALYRLPHAQRAVLHAVVGLGAARVMQFGKARVDGVEADQVRRNPRPAADRRCLRAAVRLRLRAQGARGRARRYTRRDRRFARTPTRRGPARNDVDACLTVLRTNPGVNSWTRARPAWSTGSNDWAWLGGRGRDRHRRRAGRLDPAARCGHARRRANLGRGGRGSCCGRTPNVLRNRRVRTTDHAARDHQVVACGSDGSASRCRNSGSRSRNQFENAGVSGRRRR